MKKWNELSRTEKFELISFYIEEALKDDDYYIRKEAKICLDFIANKKVTIEVTKEQLEKIKHLL